MSGPLQVAPFPSPRRCWSRLDGRSTPRSSSAATEPMTANWWSWAAVTRGWRPSRGPASVSPESGRSWRWRDGTHLDATDEDRRRRHSAPVEPAPTNPAASPAATIRTNGDRRLWLLPEGTGRIVAHADHLGGVDDGKGFLETLEFCGDDLLGTDEDDIDATTPHRPLRYGLGGGVIAPIASRAIRPNRSVGLDHFTAGVGAALPTRPV